MKKCIFLIFFMSNIIIVNGMSMNSDDELAIDFETNVIKQSSFKPHYEQCDICNLQVKLRTKYDMNFHIENMHYICTQCHKQYDSSKEIKDHKWFEHNRNQTLDLMR